MNTAPAVRPRATPMAMDLGAIAMGSRRPYPKIRRAGTADNAGARW
jgi:hypothetical protein